jgi:hypothetical protein
VLSSVRADALAPSLLLPSSENDDDLTTDDIFALCHDAFFQYIKQPLVFQDKRDVIHTDILHIKSGTRTRQGMKMTIMELENKL